MRTVTVEVHPMSMLFAEPDMKRWRVMVDGEQHSVHETEEEAEASAKDCRNRLASDWTAPQGRESRSDVVKDDWKR